MSTEDRIIALEQGLKGVQQERLLLIYRKRNKWQQVPVSNDGFKTLHSYLSKYRFTLTSGSENDYKPRREDAVFEVLCYGDG